MKPREIEIQERIIKEAGNLFFKSCYSIVTTEQIALKSGISKKTLYRYFISKKEILNTVVNQTINNTNNNIFGILQKEELNFPEKLKQIIASFANSLSSITTDFLRDVQKNLPDIWKKINEFKKDTVINHFGKLYDEGLKKGHINTNVNKDIAILILMSSIDNLLNPQFIKQLPIEINKNVPKSAYEIYNQIIKVLYEGILTDNTKKQYTSK